jgi:hypothetical protein
MPIYTIVFVAAVASCCLATQSAALAWQMYRQRQIDKARADYDLRIAKCVEEALHRTQK